MRARVRCLPVCCLAHDEVSLLVFAASVFRTEPAQANVADPPQSSRARRSRRDHDEPARRKARPRSIGEPGRLQLRNRAKNRNSKFPASRNRREDLISTLGLHIHGQGPDQRRQRKCGVCPMIEVATEARFIWVEPSEQRRPWHADLHGGRFAFQNSNKTRLLPRLRTPIFPGARKGTR